MKYLMIMTKVVWRQLLNDHRIKRIQSLRFCSEHNESESPNCPQNIYLKNNHELGKNQSKPRPPHIIILFCPQVFTFRKENLENERKFSVGIFSSISFTRSLALVSPDEKATFSQITQNGRRTKKQSMNLEKGERERTHGLLYVIAMQSIRPT